MISRCEMMCRRLFCIFKKAFLYQTTFFKSVVESQEEAVTCGTYIIVVCWLCIFFQMASDGGEGSKVEVKRLLKLAVSVVAYSN